MANAKKKAAMNYEAGPQRLWASPRAHPEEIRLYGVRAVADPKGAR